MKNKLKIFFIAFLSVFLLIACSNQASEGDGSKSQTEDEKKETDTQTEVDATSVTVKNLSNAHLQIVIGTNQEDMQDKKDLPSGSEIQFSTEKGDTLSEGLTYIMCAIYRTDAVSMESEPIICKLSEPLNITKNENTTCVITDNTVVIDFMDPSNKGTVSTILSSPVLTVKNASSYDLYDVKFMNVQFFSASLEKILGKDAEDKHAIYDATTGTILSSESGYLYFTRESDKTVLRTKKSITVKRGKSYVYEIKDDTEVVEVNNETNYGALSTIEKKVVFYEGGDNDDLKQFSTKTNTFAQHLPSEYITEDEKQHETYLTMGPDGRLSFKVNMGNDGKFSFWYASPFIVENKGIFFSLSVNGNKVAEYRAKSYDEWTFYETDLESGENIISFAVIEDDLNYRGNSLYLDDLLIVYKD